MDVIDAASTLAVRRQILRRNLDRRQNAVLVHCMLQSQITLPMPYRPKPRISNPEAPLIQRNPSPSRNRRRKAPARPASDSHQIDDPAKTPSTSQAAISSDRPNE